MINFNALLRENASILVVGLGYRTGLQTANFLIRRNFKVTVNDIKPEDSLLEIINQLDKGIDVITGHQSPDILNEKYDLIVLSPGVPAYIDLIKKAHELEIPVIAEVELSYYYMKGYWIGITGTDGKSTTTALIAHVLKGLGYKAREGGNIGIPLISLVDSSDDDTITVAELSSFQLETISSFRPDVSVILNITPDHLDRYNGISEYLQAKLRICMNQNNDDYVIYNIDDALLKKSVQTNALKKKFSLIDRNSDSYYSDGSVFIKENDKPVKVINSSELSIMGIHNVQNTMAAMLTVKCICAKMGKPFNIDAAAQQCALFKGLPHRMERLGSYKGRNFINDSKATTIGSVEMAIRSVDKNSIFIIGGRAKGDDYFRLAEIMKGKVKAVLLIGETKDDLSVVFKDFAVQKVVNMESALAVGMKISSEGDTIILSPAAASFDMYKNYEQRGDDFKAQFERLKKGEISWT